jgi:hypothetical protein
MYRCHFTQRGRIVLGENLEVMSLCDAVAAGHQMLVDMAGSQDLDGLEIWDGVKLIYTSHASRPA